MEKFKPTVVSSEFVSSVSDAIQNKSAVVFTTSLASSSVLTDDQAMTNNFQKSKSYSQGVVGTVTGYKNTDTNMLVANVKISNKSLNADMKISTVMIYGTYNGNDILVATSRLNEPELLPAFDSEKGTPVTIELAVYIQVSNIENAKVQFNDAGLATNADLQHVDESVVHKTGGEVIDGVKTFNQPINGVADINVRSLWDGYDIDKLKTTGFYVGNDIKVLQSSAKENFSLLVENAGNGSKVKQTKVVFYQSGEIKTLVRFFEGTWSLFTEVPTDDTRLIHNSGDETISGIKTFNDDTIFDKNVTVKGALHATADWANGADFAQTALSANSSKRADYADKAGEAVTANYKNNLLEDDFDVSTIGTSGYYYARKASGITGVPKEFNSKYFDLTTWVNGSNGFMFIIDDANNLYYRKRQNGVWQDYTPMPLDANKFTRNDRRETIHEEWTFEKNLHATVDWANGAGYADKAGEAVTANYKNNLLEDGFDVSTIGTSGYYYARKASGITGVPKEFNSKYFDLTTWINGSNGFMFIVDDANNLYYRKRQNGVWQDYTPMPLDANKFTRNDRRETIHEEWTFEKNLHATVDNAYRNVLIKVNENYSADNLTEPGTYCAENGHLTGLPAYPIWGTLEVMNTLEGNVIQRFNVTNGMDAYVIQRVKNNNGWRPWRTIV